MPADQLLSDKEFDELDKFLLSDRCGDDTMTMDALHGFLTAVVIGPEAVPASEWVPRIWGTEPDDLPEFKTPAESLRIGKLLEKVKADITLTLEVAPKDFEPLFCEHEWQGKQVLDAEAWAWGFMEGISLRKDAWQPLWDSPESTLLRAIYLLGAEEVEESELKLVDDPGKCHKLALEIEASISQINRLWRSKTSH